MSGTTVATEDFSSINLQPILDLWGDLVRAGGMPALAPTHVEAMARALKKAANAALISAAPELYEALSELLRTTSPDGSIEYQMAREAGIAAIQRAGRAT